MPLWDQILDLQAKLADLRKEYFFDEILFNYHWWILVGQTLVLWAIWLILVDRSRLRNILLVGLFSLAYALVLDDMGLSTGAWNYPYKIVYFTTRLNPVDMVILPVAFMLIYQYFRKWRGYLIATVLFAAFASFIAEPLFVKIDLYTMIHWKYLYSAPIYVIIGIFVKGATDIIERIERKAKGKEGS